jgi:phenylpropionate dioxygenase-like ring-hydroxylating dioxygenase large terminal subunit
VTSIDDPQIAISKRSGGRSVPEYFRRDVAAPPQPLLSSRPGYFGTEDLSTDRYLSPEWHRREMARVWPKVWQVACHEQEIAAVGDHFVYEIGSRSFLVVRSGVHEIKAYYNACLHRGTKLKLCAGNSNTIRCPFHGWTWQLNGTLEHIPAKWDFPHVDEEKFGLIEARVQCWGGFVFICEDPEAPSLARWLEPLPEHFTRMPYENRQLVAHVRRIVPVNWKVAQEAFIESYHVSSTHPQNSMNTNDLDTQYDILSDNVSRMITLVGVPGPSDGYALDDQEILDSLAEGSAMGMPDGTPFQVGQAGSARAVLTEVVKDMWARQAGIDTSRLTAYDLIDGVEYAVFPNFVPWAGMGIPFAYTFTPYGDDPDQAAWDIWVLWPRPEGAPANPAPPVRVVTDHEDFASVSELSWVGHLFDQDMANMRRIQSGLKTLPKGITMSAYQESRIRHHHQRLDSFLDARP